MQSHLTKNSHCSYCGSLFPVDLPWPRHCPVCHNRSYINPLPVSVVLLPVGDGLLLVRRTQEPQAGKLSLPGGYIELGETWQQAGAREMFEETGYGIDADRIHLFDTLSGPDGTVLVFGLAPARAAQDLPPFVPSNETSEMCVALSPLELAFSTHTQVMARYWKEIVKEKRLNEQTDSR
jgi:ADP-ribose pyrophosphatase YjhB (NUDIX family)